MDRNEPADDLDLRIAERKSSGAGILDCIKYVMETIGCSLGTATDVVINSKAWIGQKDDFLQQQADFFEEFLADNIDRIESIEMTIKPDRTDVTAHMKHEF